MAGVSLSFLNTSTLPVANMSTAKNSKPMPMRPTAIKAPMESPAFKPKAPSNMSVRVAQRLNRGTRPMPVAEMSIAIVPKPTFISYLPEPSSTVLALISVLLSAIGPPNTSSKKEYAPPNPLSEGFSCHARSNAKRLESYL